MAYVIHLLGSTLSSLSKSSLVHALCLLRYCYMLLGYPTPNKQTNRANSIHVGVQAWKGDSEVLCLTGEQTEAAGNS